VRKIYREMLRLEDRRYYVTVSSARIQAVFSQGMVKVKLSLYFIRPWAPKPTWMLWRRVEYLAARLLRD
jgi:hypothetical protein